MPSTVIVTVVRMLEELPEAVQNQIVEHMREYIEDIRDEARWESTYKDTEGRLVSAARQAKREIADGQAKPLDYDQL
jgi:cation transport regulator ChaB